MVADIPGKLNYENHGDVHFPDEQKDICTTDTRSAKQNCLVEYKSRLKLNPLEWKTPCIFFKELSEGCGTRNLFVSVRAVPPVEKVHKTSTHKQ